MLNISAHLLKQNTLWLLAGLLFAVPCHAEESVVSSESPLSLHGFGTLGLARSSSDTAEYVRDLSQPRGLTKGWSGKIDSVLGAQANLKLGSQTEGVIQIVSRYRYDGSFKPEVSWAFLSHEFSPDVQARLGRLGTEFYMLSDSRLIGYSNPTVRPPPDFFVPLIFSYFDGADVSAGTSLGSGIIRAKLFYGHSPETTAFSEPVTWNLDGSRLMGGHIDYSLGPWQFRAGHAEARFSSHELPLNALVAPLLAPVFAPFPPPDITTLVPELTTIDKTSKFNSIGAVYDKGPLRVQAMYGRIRHESSSYEDSRSAFVIGSYRFSEFTPYVGYSKVKSTPKSITTPLPPELAAVANGLLTIPHMDQHTVTLGTRWDFHRNMAMKVQLDAVRGAQDSVFPFRGPAVQWGGRMNVMSVTVDFAF